MSHSCSIHSSTDGHLGCFHNFVIVNDSAMNIGVLRLFWISVSGSCGYIPRSGITESKGRFIFNFLRYLHTAFHSGSTNLLPTNSAKVFPFLHILATTFFFKFTDDSHCGKQCGWRYLKKLKMDLTFDSAIPLLGIYPKEHKTLVWKNIRTPMSIEALFTITKIWKQPKCPSVDEWIKKLWYTYTMEYYSAIKKKEILPFVTV